MDLCQFLEWDSAFFGYRIAKVNIDRVDDSIMGEIYQWCFDQKVQCLYFLARADDDDSVRLLEENQFHFVDIRMELSCMTVPSEQNDLSRSDDFVISSFVLEDLEKLEKIVEKSFIHSRFYFDKNFSDSQASNLYLEWLRKGCVNSKETVLVASKLGEVQGFIIYQIAPHLTGKISLIGVGEDSQGKGVGTLLVEAAKQNLAQHGIKSVEVVTQGRNISAQRLYQKCGFRSSSVHLWYHKWFLDNAAHDKH